MSETLIVRSLNPSHTLTVLNLVQVPIWRLELTNVNLPGDVALVGIGIRYLIPGNNPPTAVCLLVGLDCRDSKDASHIVKNGLPKATPAANKEYLSESFKILTQSDVLKSQESDLLIAKSSRLVDIYYDILAALRTGAEYSDAFEGYRWTVGKTLFGWQFQDDKG